MADCEHADKAFDTGHVLTSNPSGMRWICRTCGEEGISFGPLQPQNQYELEKQRRSRPSPESQKGER